MCFSCATPSIITATATVFIKRPAEYGPKKEPKEIIERTACKP
jgi:hypothetical protein